MGPPAARVKRDCKFFESEPEATVFGVKRFGWTIGAFLAGLR